MGDRGLLDLSIARIPSLSYAQRVLLSQKLDGERDLSVLSLLELEKITEKAWSLPSWNPEQYMEEAQRDLEALKRHGIDYVAYGDRKYPPLLRELTDPPVVLFYRGVLPNPEQPLAAVVGTRRPSGAGAAGAYEFGRDLALSGVSVISGLAKGIDAQAHRGNLAGGGKTIAVLGNGLDRVYPASNRTLGRRIVESGGALISEYPPGSLPQKWHFPARNRIISVLARATVIIEAPEKSGALITAQFALDQGRDLWVASVGLSSPHGAGGRTLADQGARVATCGTVILEDWAPWTIKKPNESKERRSEVWQ